MQNDTHYEGIGLSFIQYTVLEPFFFTLTELSQLFVWTLTLTLGLSSTADNSLDSDKNYKKPEQHCFARLVDFS